MREGSAYFRPLATQIDNQCAKGHGPDHAMKQHFECRHGLDEFEIDWQYAPQRISDQARDNTVARGGFVFVCVDQLDPGRDSAGLPAAQLRMRRPHAKPSSSNMYSDGIKNSVMTVANTIPNASETAVGITYCA